MREESTHGAVFVTVLLHTCGILTSNSSLPIRFGLVLLGLFLSSRGCGRSSTPMERNELRVSVSIHNRRNEPP